MPSVDFTLPHWLYWSGLIVFPIVAMVLSRGAQPERGKRHASIAYFIWLVGGFLGFHRLYLKSNWGFFYWPLFALILITNSFEREARLVQSESVAALSAIERSKARGEKSVARAQKAISKAKSGLETLGSNDTNARRRFERTIKKNDTRIGKEQSKIAKLDDEGAKFPALIEAAGATRAYWSTVALYTFFTILAMLAFDALRIPFLTRAANAYLNDNPETRAPSTAAPDDTRFVGKGLWGAIDRISLLSGEFVAFWSVIAVFVYYYEVIVRYVFNSPTNWAHESMFLMFGMQYLIAGAYAMLTENHVRVDIFYSKFSPRGKAFVDLLTSVFFFLFAFALLTTGWLFAVDSMRQNQVSLSEWAVHYWPVKLVIVLGALLLILQGISKLAKDIALVISPNGAASHGA